MANSSLKILVDMFWSKSAKLAGAFSIGAALVLVNSPVCATPFITAGLSLVGVKSPVSVAEDNPSLEVTVNIFNKATETISIDDWNISRGATSGDTSDAPVGKAEILENAKENPCKKKGHISPFKDCNVILQFTLPNEADQSVNSNGEKSGITEYTFDVITSALDYPSNTASLKFAVEVHDHMPEPSSLGLILTGLIALGGIGLSRRKCTQSSSDPSRNSPTRHSPDSR